MERILDCAVLIHGSLGPGVLIPGAVYRVEETHEYWQPTGVKGELPVITTVVRFSSVEAGSVTLRDADPLEAEGMEDWIGS